MDRLKYIKKNKGYKIKNNICVIYGASKHKKCDNYDNYDNYIECTQLYNICYAYIKIMCLLIKYIISKILIIFIILNIYVLSNVYEYPIFLYFFGNTMISLSYQNKLIMSMFQIIQIMVWIVPAYYIYVLHSIYEY